MSNRIAIAGGAVLVLLFLIYSSFFVVNQRQQAIVIRFGQITDVKTDPGIYFKLPFAFLDADRVQYVSNQELRLDLDNMRVQVSGGKFYEVDAFVVYRITNAQLFREIAA
ncbi:MAG: protease modulator HflC, partial [Rhizobiaceae bacterium]